MFVFGAVVYLLIVRFAMRAKANAGMVQIFTTFGLAIVMRGLAQLFFTPDYRSIPQSWLGGKTVSIAGIFLPEPQLVGALVSIAAFAGLYFFIHRTDFGRALEATREDPGAASTRTACSRSVGALALRLSVSPARSWRCSSISIPTLARHLR
jgi:branched-chain amino acid transport system permease protein